MSKIDFHTHTCYSYDAFTTIDQLEKFFAKNPDFVLAITDHNAIKGALEAKKRFGKKIIVGEEIKTKYGEIVGYYLSEYVEPGLDIDLTIEKIRLQNGLIGVPHPFKRHGNTDSPLNEDVLNAFIKHFDFIEVFNARNRTPGANRKARNLAEKFGKPMVIGTDAHAVYELGTAYVIVPEYNGKDDLSMQLSKAVFRCQSINFFHRLLTRIKREVSQKKQHG